MRIAILGLGYVGTTTAACLAKAGHHVLGVDINPDKVQAIAAGRSPVLEPQVEELLAAGHRDGRVASATSLAPHLDGLDLVIVCVGTPSRADGKLDLAHLLEVTRQLGAQLKRRAAGAPLLLVVRSTVPPGTMEELVLPTLERAAGEGPGQRYEVAFNPEFLRESTAVKDYFAPPKIVVGERRPGVTRRLKGMYQGIEAPFFEVPFATAEMVKFVDNSFHAVKVAFANEVGRIGLAMGLDPQAVADLFLADTKLNVSSAYLRPGGPDGGSCLPKDLGAMIALAHEHGLAVPVLEGARRSNAAHLAFLVAEIRKLAPPPGPILQLGLSFKGGTDDLRNSPLVDLADRLTLDGYELAIFDPDVDPSRLLGVNFALAAEYQRAVMDCLVADPAPAAARAALILLGKAMPGIRERLPQGARLVDLQRLRAWPALG